MGMGMGMGMVPFGVPMPGMQMNGMPMMNGRRPKGISHPTKSVGYAEITIVSRYFVHSLCSFNVVL